MNPKLHSNRELNDYSINDSFDFLTKAEAIKIFLEQNSASLEENKMIILYGDWGSGKTSLMRHIANTIEPIIYKPIFFQAWEHEKDENLALSLCDALIEALDDKTSEIVKSFMKGALLTLKGFTNAVTFKSSHLLEKLGLEFEFSGEKFNEAIDKAFEKGHEPSFYVNNKEFKASFLAIEEQILKKYESQKLLIFIDDLDRCEPENVLNLITALKLFFTYGKRSVFFCGIDKEAVTKAVKTKYKDVVKSEEYMEKVFDIAFSMPKTFSITKLLEPYFPGETVLRDGRPIKNTILIESFFNTIRFTNPRHLKKVLNKYEIIKSFKALSAISENTRKLIPDIIVEKNKGNTFETIYCLFIILLYEFHLEDFTELENYEEKILKYIEPSIEFHKLSSSSPVNYDSTATNLRQRYFVTDHTKTSLSTLFANRGNAHSFSFTKFLFLFSHSEIKYLAYIHDNDLTGYDRSFNDTRLLTSYCKFLIKYKEEVISSASDYPIWNLFEMVKYLL
ncbi:KAP family P-loop NTPase fold protein [Mucilaginibacter sp.]|uniref:KAP family P-loop NTPase fold protein n=1 Tax=Mucilaginibacter sp. TaxID=1882438 RepID=UPI002ED0A585